MYNIDILAQDSCKFAFYKYIFSEVLIIYQTNDFQQPSWLLAILSVVIQYRTPQYNL